MSHAYDVIVVGIGAVGSAAALHLARRGVSVLGIEQFHTPHNKGSSHGETRAIRQAYFEDPAYVPLLKRAYALWYELQEECSAQLLVRCGLLQVGADDGPLITGVRRSALEHQLPIDTLTPAQLSSDFSQFRIPSGLVALYESNAGYLLVEECLRAQIHCAKAMGATLQFNSPVLQWSRDAGTFTVSTAAGQYRSQRLVFACGPWAGAWLTEYSASLHVVLKHLYWFQPGDDRFRQRDCPVFLYELPHGVFYGVPATSSGVKVGEHSGGMIVPQGPDDRARQPDPHDRDRVTDFVQSCLQGLQPPISESTCWYTMSPDGHFLVDESVTNPGLYFVAGLSGHGFKFAPVLGEIVADLVTTGSTPHPIAAFRASRFEAA